MSHREWLIDNIECCWWNHNGSIHTAYRWWSEDGTEFVRETREEVADAILSYEENKNDNR